MFRQQIHLLAAMTLVLAAVGAWHWREARRESAAPSLAALVHPTPPGKTDFSAHHP